MPFVSGVNIDTPSLVFIFFCGGFDFRAVRLRVDKGKGGGGSGGCGVIDFRAVRSCVDEGGGSGGGGGGAGVRRS
jgi:hypothetical protein